MKKTKGILEWRRLDNSAKIFPISTGKKYSNVFRLSAIMTQNVSRKQLEEAVNITLEKFKSFKVRMKWGFFWYYFEHNPKKPIIEKERQYPCKYINSRENNNYLFKVTYFKNKINIEIFHSLADGNSGTIFFKEIIYTYLELVHPKTFMEDERITRKVEEVNTEDSYMVNYDRKAKSKASVKKAYKLKGNKIGLGAVSVIHNIIDLKQLKEISKKNNSTITQYLTAVLIYSIYTENYKKSNQKKPIKVCIPVDLRKYFPSKTMSNFFSYITIEACMEKKSMENFHEILEFVKQEFKKQLVSEEIKNTMSTNVKIGTNPFIKMVPLVLKKIFTRLSYIEIRKYTTITFSNIGRMGIIGKYQKYLKYFVMLIAPEPIEKIKCSACSFENKIVFTFTSILKDKNIESSFYKILTNQGIKIEIESNGVLDDLSKKN